MFNYIIYHNNCFDGYTGFYLFMKTNKWEKNPIVYPDYPSSNTIPPDIKGKNVIIIDVAYSSHIVKQIAKEANMMLFIDHHVSIADDIKNLKLSKPHEIIYDVNESGASLVWKYFFKNKPIPTFVKYIRDNDIGLWELDNTLNFMVYIEMNLPTTPDLTSLKKWDKLLDDEYLDKIVQKGSVYNEYKTHLIEYNANKHSIMRFPSKRFTKKNTALGETGQYKVAVINNGCPSVSLIGKYIVENYDCDFCMIWNYNILKKKYVCSLRSKKADVGTIAKEFGGGGHKFASAFSFYGYDTRLDDLFIK